MLPDMTAENNVDASFLAEVLERSQTGTAVYDSDGSIKYVNQCYAAMVETTTDEFEGRHITCLNPEFERESFDEFWASFADGEVRQSETAHQTLDGGRTFPVTVTTIHTTIDGQEYHVTTATELGKRNASKRHLERYKRLVENLPIGVIRNTPGPDGSVRLVNSAMVELLDADSKAQIRESTVADLYADPDEREQFSERLRDEGIITQLELQMETFEGETIWCEVSAVAVEEDGDTVFEVTIQDITERREYKNELTLFKRAVEQAGNSVIITDKEGVIEYVNPAFEVGSGYAGDTALGKTPALLNSGKHDDGFYEDLWETILSGEVWESELINQRRSGKFYYVKHTITPITDDDGEIKHFVGIQSDITDRKLREKRLSELTRILRHNLRNAVAALQGHAELLQDTISEENKPRLDRILKQVDNLAATSEKATEIRHISSGEYDGDSTCNLHTLLSGLTPELREEYPDAAISVDHEPVAVDIDQETCRILLMELVDNAVLHNDRERPEVSVSVDPPTDDAKHVRLSVADNGSGIPIDEQETVDIGTENPLTHGSGIGLSHVHLIVTKHGGEVTISDNTPRGSVVSLLLPRAMSE